MCGSLYSVRGVAIPDDVGEDGRKEYHSIVKVVGPYTGISTDGSLVQLE